VEVARDRDEVAGFLESLGLGYDRDSEITVAVRHDGEIVATGSLRGCILQCFAVRPEFRGTGLSAAIAGGLIKRAFDDGRTRLFVFTTPENAGVFTGIGFRLLVRTRHAALLETGTPTVEDYIRDLSVHAISAADVVGGLVMNCNPFTIGHRYLVECASRSCDHVFILVVEEDRSAFPFHVRLDLVKRGIAHLPNVTVLPAGPYAVSLATFPAYFSQEETAHAKAGASVDAAVYGKYVAGALGVNRRFVGTEPYSPVTAIYNETMREVLSEYGIELIEIPRLEVQGKAVSASDVRDMLRADDYQRLAELVPQSTYKYLTGPKAAQVIIRLKSNATGRH